MNCIIVELTGSSTDPFTVAGKIEDCSYVIDQLAGSSKHGRDPFLPIVLPSVNLKLMG